MRSESSSLSNNHNNSNNRPNEFVEYTCHGYSPFRLKTILYSVFSFVAGERETGTKEHIFHADEFILYHLLTHCHSTTTVRINSSSITFRAIAIVCPTISLFPFDVDGCYTYFVLRLRIRTKEFLIMCTCSVCLCLSLALSFAFAPLLAPRSWIQLNQNDPNAYYPVYVCVWLSLVPAMQSTYKLHFASDKTQIPPPLPPSPTIAAAVAVSHSFFSSSVLEVEANTMHS